MSRENVASDSHDAETPLLTARLLLEPVRSEHAASLFAPLQDPRLYTYIPDDPPTSLEALQDRYRRWERRISPDGREVWLNWIARALASGEWVGTFQATITEDHQALLAYMIFPSYQRQGFACEGCLSVIEHLVERYGVKFIAAEIDMRNASSIALLTLRWG